MRGMVLASMSLLSLALPAAAQTTLGIRAGLGSASVPLGDIVVFEPCLPDVECPGFANGSVRGLTIGADLGFPLSGDVLDVRIGGAFAEKGGAGSGWDANGGPLKGTLSMSYLQFSSLLRARTSGPQSAGVLFGPWVAIRLSCAEDGRLANSCDSLDAGHDAGWAFGGGVELSLPSRLSVSMEGMYYRGRRELSRYYETTRLVVIQAGFVLRIG